MRSVAASRGQTLAEFAIVLPIFLVLVLGIFDVGRAVFIYNGLTNAVREGARLAAVNQDKDLIADRAQAMSFGVDITTSAPNLTRFFRSKPDTDDVTQNDPCILGDTDTPMAVGCIAVVEASTTWRAITPIIGGLIGPLPLTARSELPVEFVCPSLTIAAYANPDDCPSEQP